MWSKITNASFKTKVIGLVVAATLVQGLSSYVNFRMVANGVESDILSDFKIHPEALGNKISAQFFERYGDVQAFAMNDAVQSLEPQRVTEVLDKYVQLYGLYDLIVVTDRHGNLVATNTKDFEGKEVQTKKLLDYNFKKEEWFNAVINGTFTEDKERGFSGTYFEDFKNDEMMKAAFGETRFISGFSAPIKNAKGETLGVITNRAGSRWIENEFVSTYKDFEKLGKTETQFHLINKEGFVLIDYAPVDLGDKKYEVPHDEKVLFAENKKENDFYSHINSGIKSWSGYSVNSEHKELEVLGYASIENSKWIPKIGWTVVISESKEEALAHINHAMIRFYAIFGTVLFFAIAMSIWFAVLMAKKVESIISQLVKNSGEVSNASQSMASQSNQLSEASTEQAAALQETVAAVDEISAMVEKNTDAASRSQEVSANSRNSAIKGKEAVEQMLRSIEEINQSNQEITSQVSENEKQMNDVTQLIKNIGQKTKVIDEIVFQTKLLSFNASVEAARAGEAGKGFAVVAEEVGNLAQMSGHAAKEINQMLDQSVQKVEHMVRQAQTNFSSIIQSSQHKVETGNRTAQECNVVLEEIIENVTSVDTLVSEIAVASKEQSQGIREISKAIGQMEQVTQQNTSVAQSSSHEAEELSQRSSELNHIVGELKVWMTGDVDGDHGSNPVASPRSKSNSKQSFSEPRKVIAFKKKASPAAEKSKPQPVATAEHQPPSEPTSYKKASGGDEVIPSSDDPGFGE